MEPEVGLIFFARILASVVFPTPLGQTIPKICLEGKEKFRF
jgi:hypothetical protein